MGIWLPMWSGLPLLGIPRHGGNDGVGPGRCATMKLAKLLERQFDFGDMAAAGAVPK
jgi:hypothetical protein